MIDSVNKTVTDKFIFLKVTKMADRLEKFFAAYNQANAENAAKEYINAGGNVLEILKSLDASKKKNVNTVFSAMQSVIIK